MIRHTWHVFGEPRPQPRPRAYRRGAHAGVYNPKSSNRWKEQIKNAIAAAGGPEEPLGGVIELTLLFRLPRPKSHYTKDGEALLPEAPTAHTQTPDIENLVKAVMDAMVDMGVMADDSQVVRLIASKSWCQPLESGVSISLSSSF